jgi:hypothetical protein
MSLKSDFLHGVPVQAIRSVPPAAVESLDPRQSTVNDASQFAAKFRRAVIEQALLRFFSRKPGGVSIRFLWRFQPRYFAKVGSDPSVCLG